MYIYFLQFLNHLSKIIVGLSYMETILNIWESQAEHKWLNMCFKHFKVTGIVLIRDLLPRKSNFITGMIK